MVKIVSDTSTLFSKKEGAYFALVKFSDLEVQEVVITMLALVF